MNKPPIHWTDDRVDRLLLQVFGDPPGGTPPVPRATRSRWSNGALVGLCAAILALVAPVLFNAPNAVNLAEQRASAEAQSEDIVVADASSSDSSEELSSDASDERSSDESSETESSEEASETTST